jgi:hypothetical protein
MVGFTNGQVTCNPWNAEVYYDYPAGPSGARWIVKEAPPGATAIQIVWESGSPFGSMESVPDTEGEGMSPFEIIEGGKLAHVTADFKYTIVFVDSAGRSLAEVDPVIIDKPRP